MISPASCRIRWISQCMLNRWRPIWTLDSFPFGAINVYCLRIQNLLHASIRFKSAKILHYFTDKDRHRYPCDEMVELICKSWSADFHNMFRSYKDSKKPVPNKNLHILKNLEAFSKLLNIIRGPYEGVNWYAALISVYCANQPAAHSQPDRSQVISSEPDSFLFHPVSTSANHSGTISKLCKSKL